MKSKWDLEKTQFLIDHYDDPNWSIEKLAEKFGVKQGTIIAYAWRIRSKVKSMPKKNNRSLENSINKLR